MVISWAYLGLSVLFHSSRGVVDVHVKSLLYTMGGESEKGVGTDLKVGYRVMSLG